MGQAHVKRRQRQRPLRAYESVVSRELDRVSRDLGFAPPAPRRHALIEEAVGLASPYRFPGIDAVIPAERPDLLRAWLLLRITGLVESPQDIERAARQFAPAPDDDFRPRVRETGDPTSSQVLSAHVSRHPRRLHRGGGGATAI